MIRLLSAMEQVPASERQRTSPSLIRPEDAPRPLWYRAAGALEPFRPLFTWAVAHKRWIMRIAIPIAGATGMALVARWQFRQQRRK